MLGIVIPLYKKDKDLSEDEIISLKLVTKYSKELDIPFTLVIPHSLRDSISPDVSFVSFDNEHFSSLDSYNKLMLRHEFYQALSNYEYILIYQLDCLLLRDNLLSWLNTGYDYIGACWMDDFKEDGDRFTAVGNGGFSLRKVSSTLNVFKLFGNPAQIDYPGHEDVFWSLEVPRAFPFLWYRVAPVEEAKYFAVETGVRLNQNLLKGSYPTGVHAFGKRERDYFINLLIGKETFK
jgi:hypothetical protein